MQPPSPSSRGTATAAEVVPAVALDALELHVADLDRTRSLLESAFGFEALDAPCPQGSGGAPPCPEGSGGEPPCPEGSGGEPPCPEGSGWEPPCPERSRGELVARVASGGVRLVLREGPSVAARVARHGDTVTDVALVCAEPEAIARRAAAAGLHVDRSGGVPRIDVLGDGAIRHSLRAAPLFSAPDRAGAQPSMLAVDHVTYCLEHGTADRVAEIYADVLGLEPAALGDFERVGDDATGMRSLVLGSPGLTVVLIEPLSASGSGQIQRFIDAHAGPGVQHAALAYDDLCAAVEALRARGVRFLPAPGEYYERSRERLADRPLQWDALRRLEILVDADDDGVLYQLFTRPLTERGTFFFELIERSGASGFGGNNVRALFSAVAQAQRASTTAPVAAASRAERDGSP